MYARDTRTLERYVDVVKGRKRPKYRILKMIPVSFNPSDSTEKLWSLHDSLLEEYLGIEAEDDSGRPRSQFALTERSFLDLKIELRPRGRGRWLV